MSELEQNLINIAREIYSTLGRGFTENVYHKAFETELRLKGIPYETEKIIPFIYKGYQVGFGRADIVLENIVLEFKSIVNKPKLQDLEQIYRYMKYLEKDKGIVINFGQPSQLQRDDIDYVVILKNGDIRTTTLSAVINTENSIAK
jgi:GxxExxY protein